MVFDRDIGFSHGWHLWSVDYYDEDDNDNDDDNDDDDDDYSCNSVNFQARTSKFCMELEYLKYDVDEDDDNVLGTEALYCYLPNLSGWKVEFFPSKKDAKTAKKLD